MPDFTSALYLGLAHGSATLRPWTQLTTGKPAALQALPGSLSLAADFAALAGVEAATFAPSTLHVFQDLFDQWPHRAATIYADAELYQVGCWGVERAAFRGARTIRFRHHDPASLARAMGRQDAGKPPVVVTDGFCPLCGNAAPLPAYLELLKESRGWLVMDDTQAFGVLGRNPGPAAPLGSGGGGTLQWHGIASNRVLLVSSLAKAFGAPLAMLAGPLEFIDRFTRVSSTRVHSSGISRADLHAAEEAFAFNERSGNRTRAHLAGLIRMLARRMAGSTAELTGGMFPVQSTGGVSGVPAVEIHRRLESAEVHTVLQRDHKAAGQARVGILLTAAHNARDIERLARALLAATKGDAAWTTKTSMALARSR